MEEKMKHPLAFPASRKAKKCRRKTWPNIMTLSFRSSASARDFVNFYREIKAGGNTIESIDVEKIKKFSKVHSQTQENDYLCS